MIRKLGLLSAAGFLLHLLFCPAHALPAYAFLATLLAP